MGPFRMHARDTKLERLEATPPSYPPPPRPDRACEFKILEGEVWDPGKMIRNGGRGMED